jgi:hypothetical protein
MQNLLLFYSIFPFLCLEKIQYLFYLLTETVFCARLLDLHEEHAKYFYLHM